MRWRSFWTRALFCQTRVPPDRDVGIWNTSWVPQECDLPLASWASVRCRPVTGTALPPFPLVERRRRAHSVAPLARPPTARLASDAAHPPFFTALVRAVATRHRTFSCRTHVLGHAQPSGACRNVHAWRASLEAHGLVVCARQTSTCGPSLLWPLSVSARVLGASAAARKPAIDHPAGSRLNSSRFSPRTRSAP